MKHNAAKLLQRPALGLGNRPVGGIEEGAVASRHLRYNNCTEEQTNKNLLRT
jgi:hypothetical protein